MEKQDINLTVEQQDQLLFMMLVQQHEQIGMMGLGKIKNPSTDTIEPNINSAKYAIDTLSMLERYTSGSLNNELKSYLQHVLSTLRLNFVDMKKAEKEKSGTVAVNEEPTDDKPAGDNSSKD